MKFSKNTIFIFEFVSGGGFANVNIPTSLFCEGFGMLRSIISDFKALDFEVYTMLDYRVLFLLRFLHANEIRKVKKSDNYVKIFKNLVDICKYVFIIAPETSNILLKLTKIAKKRGKIVLSTNLNAIKISSSKIINYKIFKKNNILTPKTFRIPYRRTCLDTNFIIHKFRELKCPIVIKPEDGVGAESVHYFEKESQILDFFMDFNAKLGKRRKYILQEFVEGRDLSISLIGSPYLYLNPTILSVNSQNVNIKQLESEYLGGCTPIENLSEIIKKLYTIIEKLNNLKIEGYFGIDFIENHNYSFNFIEINPRLTTSYIGLRNILNFNCAELIFDTKFKNISDLAIKIQNHSCFTRIDFSHNNIEDMELPHEEPISKLMKLIPEFITPPISLNVPNKYSCFIATKTKDLISSKTRLKKIIQIIENLNFNVIKPIKTKLL
ncbi:MAG: ATP-grasp domain-containing protein [Promethearchaeota archaeon]